MRVTGSDVVVRARRQIKNIGDDPYKTQCGQNSNRQQNALQRQAYSCLYLTSRGWEGRYGVYLTPM
jgi:hypothetical protein